MLRITIELVPFGEEAERREIARAIVYNDGTGDAFKGRYVAAFCESGNFSRLMDDIEHWRGDGPWVLVGKAIAAAFKQ